MLTSALVTLAKKEFSDWSRTMILTFLDELQNMVFTQSTTSHMQMYDSTTGKDPTLTVTSGTYEYDINTTNGFDYNAWRVTAVYSSSIDSPEDVCLLDATRGVAAKVRFKASTSGTYYVRAYRFPTALSTESIQLEIPQAYHISHVYEGLCGLIEKARSGKSERWEKFERILLPQLIKKMSDVDSTVQYVTYRGY